MILVTVGTHTQGFERLIKKMDEIAEKIDEEVVMQIGSSEYIPINARYFRYSKQEEMESLNREATVIVTHAGAGSILTALSGNQPVIVVPRLEKYGEHIDDHQLQLTKILAKEDKVIPVYDIKDIEAALDEAKQQGLNSKPVKESNLAEALRRYIRECYPPLPT